MRLAAIPVLMFTAVATAAAGGFVERIEAARAARAQHQPAQAEAEIAEALKERPGHPAALYELALAQAQNGKTDAALDTLETLADQDLAYDIAADKDFASIAGERKFKSLQKQFERNREPRGRAPVLFQLLDPAFIPEGLAYDSDRGAYFVGGVHARRIDRVGRGGKDGDFVTPGMGGLWAPMGMFADTRRRLLWVASAAVPEMANAEPGELGRSAILAYDMDTAALKRRFDLKEPGPHVLGDLIVKRDGTIYTTDSRGGILYRVDSSTGAFTALTKPGQLASPQGMAFSEDGRWLYVADYTQGLFRYRLYDGELQRVNADDDVCLYGIDGLYRSESSLVAVQNGIRPHRVVRLELNDSGKRVRRATVLAANLPQFDEPSLGVVVGKRFSFIANSQWGRFDAKHELPAREQLRRPAILRVDIGSDAAPPRAQPQPQQQPSGGGLQLPPVLR